MIDTSAIGQDLFMRYPALRICNTEIRNAFLMLKHCYEDGNKVLVCGNGGSAADADHIVGELMKGFHLKRPLPAAEIDKLKATCGDWEYLSNHLQGALPAISLSSHSALSTAFVNDVAADMVYAQQVYGYGRNGDVLIALSTSGNSKNVVNAVKVANALGVDSIGITGEQGGALDGLCNICIKIPALTTAVIQEYTLPIYHALCAMLEASFFDE